MASQRQKRWKSLVPTFALVAIALFVSTQTASAFFPPIAPPQPPTPPLPPIPPIIPEPPIQPPLPPLPPIIPEPPIPPCPRPPFEPPCTPTPPPRCHCHEPPPPCGVPEPATIVSGLFGLMTLAGYRASRRLK